MPPLRPAGSSFTTVSYGANMPTTTPRQTRESRLTDTLAAKFASRVPDPYLPFIIENALAGGRSRHLLVIWDEWRI